MTALSVAIVLLAVSQVALAITVRRLARLTVETSELACKTAIAYGAHADDHRRAVTHQQIRDRARTN